MEKITIINENIKYLRLSNKLTQGEFAKIIGKKTSAVSAYENNISTPTVDTIIRLSEYFNVSASELIETKLSDPKIKDEESFNKGNLKGNLTSFKTEFSGFEFSKNDLTFLNSQDFPFHLHEVTYYLQFSLGRLRSDVSTLKSDIYTALSSYNLIIENAERIGFKFGFYKEKFTIIDSKKFVKSTYGDYNWDLFIFDDKKIKLALYILAFKESLDYVNNLIYNKLIVFDKVCKLSLSMGLISIHESKIRE